MNGKGRDHGTGPWVHNKGVKAAKDRAVLLKSYHAMCREFRVPARLRISPKDLASMTNTQLFRATSDVYACATTRQVMKLARRLGVAPRTHRFNVVAWAKTWLRGFTLRSVQ